MSDTTGPIFTVTVRGDTRQEIEDAARKKAEAFFGNLIPIELDPDYRVHEVREITARADGTVEGKYVATINARQAIAERRKSC